MKAPRGQELTRALLELHWRRLVQDNATIDLQELDARLKPITYLRRKLKEKQHQARQQKTNSSQLNLFNDEP